MDKPVRELTMGEVMELCQKRGNGTGCCGGCPLSDDNEICRVNTPPEDWDLPEEPAGTTAAKPRLAEVLGVDVNERCRLPVNGGTLTFWVTETGCFETDPPQQVGSTYLLLDAINHPESIIRAPRLTEAELERCRPYGAKWVSRDKSGIDWTVNLWREKPMYGEEIYNQTEEGSLIATIHDPNLFPSVRPGGLVEVEEAGCDA